MPDAFVLAVATLGPAAAGLVWLAASSRRRMLGRILGLLAAAAAHGAAWVVVARAYAGAAVSWRGLSPGLLEASVAAAAQVAVLLVVVRAERLPGGAATGAIVGLGVATSAVAYAAYAGSLVVWALLVPVPTIAVAVAAATDRGSRDLPGVGGLAAADLLALAGLSAVFASSGSTVLGPASGAGPVLLLAAAAVKAGAIPGVGTWRLTASGGAMALMGMALRGQAMALAMIAGITVGVGSRWFGVAWIASAVLLLAGATALLSRAHGTVLAGVLGAGAAFPFLALGLGGAVGVRAFLLLFPVALLAAGAALLAGDPESQEAPARVGWIARWGGPAALAIAAGSLAGVPPGGGFPGAWLAVHLAGARAETDAAYLPVVLLAGLGIFATALASVSLIRAARSRSVEAIPALAAGGFLVYLGAQPVRFGAGWYLRIEQAIGLPEILPSAGAPAIPAVAGGVLLGAALPAAALALLLLLLGRGDRDVQPAFEPFSSRLLGSTRRPARLIGLMRGWWEVQWERLGLPAALALLAEILALVLAVRLVFLGASQGFL